MRKLHVNMIKCDGGIVWGDAECHDNGKRAPKPSHNRLGNYTRPGAITLFSMWAMTVLYVNFKYNRAKLVALKDKLCYVRF